MEKIRYSLPNGLDCFSIVDPELGMIPEYQLYLESVASSPTAKQNTINAKAQDLKTFFEYIYAYSKVAIGKERFGAQSKNHIPRTFLADLILSYPEYLLRGPSASNIAGEIALITNSKPKDPRSCSRLLSSVNKFLKASARLQANLLSAKKYNLVDIDVVPEVLFEELLNKRSLDKSEALALLSNSMIAGVVAGGPKYVESSLFSVGAHNSEQSDGCDVQKSFPLEYPMSLLNEAKSKCSLCFWALLLGTGVRQSEAGQMLLCDIDARNREVFFINPAARPMSYLSIPDEWRKELEWKGRALKTAFFLEPYRTIFFDNIADYLRYERVGATHNFLFITMDGDKRPLFTADNASLNKSFKRAQVRLGLKKSYTLHSLRHFYGVFCRNFLKVGGKYGLEKATVQYLMGHSSERSTDTYAVIHPLILRAKLEIANNMILQNDISYQDLVRSAIEYQLTSTQEKFLGIS